MPSGPKKRKAAKKHRQNQTNNHSPTNSLQGNDEKESDIGEVSSPTESQENLNYHQLGQEEEEQIDSSPVESAAMATTVHDNNSIEDSQTGHGGDDEVVRDLKPPHEEEVVVETVIEGNSDSRIVNIECVESVKESNDHSESSSSNSSDEESGSVEKEEESQLPVMEQLQEVEEVKGEEFNLVKATEIVVDPIEKVVSLSGEGSCDPVEKVGQVVTLSEEVTQVGEVAPAEKIEDFSLKDSDEKTLPTSDVQGVEISNGGEQHTEYETVESSDSQQQVPVVRSTVQPTSWRSCCGLFDVLTGSNR